MATFKRPISHIELQPVNSTAPTITLDGAEADAVKYEWYWGDTCGTFQYTDADGDRITTRFACYCTIKELPTTYEDWEGPECTLQLCIEPCPETPQE